MKKVEFEKVLLALGKIARKVNEDKIIRKLDEQFSIEITEEQAHTNNFGSNAIWIILPENSKLWASIYKDIEEGLILPENNEKLFKRLKKNSKNLVRFAYPISIASISNLIFEILKDQHEIIKNSLTIKEWGRIYNSDEWYNVQIQVARHIIAQEIQNEIS